MKVKFKSTYRNANDDKDSIIEFSSRLEKDFEDGFEILIFKENRNGKEITNRVEYNDKILKIYSGVSAITCELNKIIKNNFVVEGMESSKFYLYTKMQKMIIKENQLEFCYQTSASDDFKESTKIKLEFKIENN